MGGNALEVKYFFAELYQYIELQHIQVRSFSCQVSKCDYLPRWFAIVSWAVIEELSNHENFFSGLCRGAVFMWDELFICLW